MTRSRTGLVVLLALVALVIASPAQAQRPDPDSPRYKGVVALSEFLQTDTPEEALAFLEERIAPTWREKLGDEHMLAMLDGLREQFRGTASRGARPIGPLSAAIVFADDRQLAFELSPDDPDRFTSIGDPE